MADDGLPPLTPTTRRILRNLERFEAQHLETKSQRIGRIRIHLHEFDLDTEPRDLTTIDPDPAHMQRLKVTEETRDLQRPDRVDDDVAICTPQFFLRNTWRADLYADPESLDFERRVMETASLGDYLADARACRFTPGDRDPVLTSEEMRVSVARRRVLMVDTPWNSIFGRAEPTFEPIDPDPQSQV